MPEIENIVKNFINLENLILISNLSTFKFDGKCS